MGKTAIGWNRWYLPYGLYFQVFQLFYLGLPCSADWDMASKKLMYLAEQDRRQKDLTGMMYEIQQASWWRYKTNRQTTNQTSKQTNKKQSLDWVMGCSYSILVAFSRVTYIDMLWNIDLEMARCMLIISTYDMRKLWNLLTTPKIVQSNFVCLTKSPNWLTDHMDP